MAKVILYIATSLDGYIAKMDHDISWLSSVKMANEDYGYQAFLSNIDAILMGSNSFQAIKQIANWPYPNKQCYVASHATDIIADENVTFITDPVSTIAQLKAANRGNIWLLGGANLADSLIRLDLVDEFIVSTIPILLGNGIRLFNAPLPLLNLRVLACTAYPSGLVQTHYEIPKHNDAS